MRELLARYPDFYKGSPEFVDLQEALQPEVLALWAARDGVLDQLNVETATWGLAYWEKALGIAVEVEKDIEFRRSRVRAKLRGAGVTTVALIKNTAESFSNGEVDVTEYPSLFRIEIIFVGTVGIPPNVEDLTQALREIMPAHLEWDYVYVFRTWSEVGALTWAQVAEHTWTDVKESNWT